MTMINKPEKLHYQQLAVTNIIRILQKQDRAVLQAPTGSGKTFIISQIIQRLLLEKNYYLKRVAFLFLAPSTGQLIHQCYTKIKTHLAKAWVRGFETCSIGTDRKNKQAFYLAGINHFKPGTMYFIGWNTLSKNSNAMRQDSERNNLIDILDNTKNQGIKLVMIIDEAHREYLQTRQQNEVSETKREFLDSAKEFTYKTIEVSATITSQNSPESIWKVTADDVREEQAIKKLIEINDFSLEETYNAYDITNDIIDLVEQGLAKQRQVQAAYRYPKANISQTPIMLIQIPDNMKKVDGFDVDKHYQETLKKVLDQHSHEHGFKYGFWLSNNKSAKSREDLIANNEVIIFKQAIATGWDIPQANILVKLRNPKKGSAVFEIQTLGRILRNPLFKYHFEDARSEKEREFGRLINNAFVFTKDEDYKKRIDKQDSVQTAEMELYALSAKGQSSTIKLRKMTYDGKIADNKLHERVYEQLLKQNFVTKLVAKAKDYKPTIEMPGKQQLATQDVIANRKFVKINTQQKMAPASSKTLFWIWLEYQEILKDYYKLKNFMDYLIERVVHEYPITKKKLYLFFTDNFEKLFSDQAKERLSELLVKSYYEVFEQIAEPQTKQLWQLNDRKAYPAVYNDTETNKVWDRVNSYQINFNHWSKEVLKTEPERQFYKFLKDSFEDPADQRQVYRNGISQANDFYIPYFSSQDNIERLFYPDFILENPETIVILDVKGGQDVEEDNKFKAAWKLMDKINATDKQLIVARLTTNRKSPKIKDQTVEFQMTPQADKTYLSLEKFCTNVFKKSY